jgi:lysylphosphatidylglycerol synthetase-like protein (DUF2156 family)
MNRKAQIALGILLLFLSASVAASLMHQRIAAMWLGAPVLVLTGWIALGHLVTLDDDFPDGWSNPSKSTAEWHRSLAWLLLKWFVFASVVWLVVFSPN